MRQHRRVADVVVGDEKVWGSPVAPCRTPRPVVDRVNVLCHDITEEPEVKKKFGDLGFFIEKLKFETVRWTKAVKDNNIKVEG